MSALPLYEAPAVTTYMDAQIMEELGQALAVSVAPHCHTVLCNDP